MSGGQIPTREGTRRNTRYTDTVIGRNARRKPAHGDGKMPGKRGIEENCGKDNEMSDHVLPLVEIAFGSRSARPSTGPNATVRGALTRA